MSHQVPTNVDASRAVEGLGYRSPLRRALGAVITVGIAVGCVSPIAATFINVPVLISSLGTYLLPEYIISAVIALALAYIYSELGSIYPLAGGLYSVGLKVLGKPMGFMTLLVYLVQAVFIPAVVALGAATYANLLVPAIPVVAWAIIFMALSGLLAISGIRASGLSAFVFVGIEAAVLIVLTVAGLAHIQQGTSLFANTAVIGKTVGPVGFGAVLGAVAIGLFGYNGFDSALNFSEETLGSSRQIGLGAVRAATIVIILEILPIVGMLLAVPATALIHSQNPINLFGTTVLGNAGVTIIEIGAVIAIFNATLTEVMQFSRILYASGRDQAWPAAISRSLAYVWPSSGTPVVSIAVVVVLGIILDIFSSLANSITFIGVDLVFLYLIVAIATVVSRFRDRSLERPYRMPIWPVMVLVSLAGSIIVLTQQTPGEILSMLAILAAGLIYYALYLARKPDWGAGDIKAMARERE
ncbi:MAG: APC family permease [Thermaerobacter sp.]|nr:APC family permease [Thermaerobacter sp.]